MIGRRGIPDFSSDTNPDVLRVLRIRTDKVHVVDAECLRKQVKRYDGRVAFAVFEAAQILLAETGAHREVLLRHTLFPTQARKIPADQLAHVHAPTDDSLQNFSLSTIVCNPRRSAVMQLDQDAKLNWIEGRRIELQRRQGTVRTKIKCH